MGDIADMHVEAYQAGLDPNEMDGADWADFYDAQERITLETMIDGIGCSARMLLCEIDDMQDEDDLDVSDTGRAATLSTYLPEFGEIASFELVYLLVRLSDTANKEGDKLRAQSEATE